MTNKIVFVTRIGRDRSCRDGSGAHGPMTNKILFVTPICRQNGTQFETKGTYVCADKVFCASAAPGHRQILPPVTAAQVTAEWVTAGSHDNPNFVTGAVSIREVTAEGAGTEPAAGRGQKRHGRPASQTKFCVAAGSRQRVHDQKRGRGQRGAAAAARQRQSQHFSQSRQQRLKSGKNKRGPHLCGTK